MELTTAILFIVILILFALPDVINEDKDRALSDYKVKIRKYLRVIDQYNASNPSNAVTDVKMISDLINIKKDLQTYYD